MIRVVNGTEIIMTPAGEAAFLASLPVPEIPDFSKLDQEALNQMLAAEGSVVRALALVLLQEINTIRTKLPVPLAAYTQAQLVAALKAKMR